ncbi:MAG TPA: ATP-binding cassette domain-containing protein [Actinomycetota bacterium]|jgi:ABC-2 type transport system ATP-binding protein
MTDTPAVECRELAYAFGTLRAVDGISFDVRAGEVFGLLGPNGAGKTTTIRILTTLIDPAEGTAEIFGLDTTHHRMQVRQMLGYVPQQLSIDGQLTGYENVWMFTRLFDVPRRERRTRAEDALASMGLADAAGRLAATYSGGMIRRLELAQALVNRPRLLILDEPTIGLDPVARRSVWERVEQLRGETGMTVLLTTHYMEEADALCDRVALMHRGRIRAMGAPAALKDALGPGATLEDVFASVTDDHDIDEGSLRDVRVARRTAGRVG